MVDQDGIDAVTRCKMQDMINELTGESFPYADHSTNERTVEQDRKDKEIKAMKEQIEKAERKGIHAEEMLASTRPTRIICIAYLILGLIFLWSYRNEGRLNRANSKMIAWEYRTQKQKVFERTFDQKERHFEAELNKRSFGQKQGL